MGKGAKNRTTARPRTAREKNAGNIDGTESPRVVSLAFPSARLSPPSERLRQAMFPKTRALYFYSCGCFIVNSN